MSMGLNKSCVLLIVIAGMERLAFKGVASNLVSYLTDVMKMSNSSAAKYVNSWMGFTSMLPLVVATLADSYWDRYPTILASSVLYAAGLLALTSTELRRPWSQSTKITSISSLSCSLYMMSLGQGGYNPSLQAFGADQLENEESLPLTNTNNLESDESNESKSDKKSLFFQWWYFGICCGSLLGVSVMSYIQDTFGWGLGFAIPTLTMIGSILMFLCGNRIFSYSRGKTANWKSFKDIFQPMKACLSKMIGRNVSSKYTLVELELEEKALCNQEPDEEIPDNGQTPNQCMNLFQSLKLVMHLLPVWAMLLMFAVIFQQPSTFFTKQGMTMKRNIGSKFKIPPAALQSAITVSIIVLMPWYDKFFIPAARFFTRNEKGITVMQRMGTGMFLSIVAMVIAAFIERTRLEISKNVDLKPEDQVPFSIFWLLPQYILLGISDIFVVVGMQEFFYSEVPVKMRTMGIALYTSVFGVGSFLSAFLITVIEYLTSHGGKEEGWFADDMNKARLDNYYWFLAFSSAVSFLAFVIFSRVLDR